MNEEEYNQLIIDIKNYLNSICNDDRMKYHIIPATEIAIKLAEEKKADKQVVEIATLLHDVTKITGDRKNHHITGADFAEDFLKNYNIESNKIIQVKNCIKKHRGSSEFTRDTIEEKIVATADSVAQIEHPLTFFYSWYGRRQCSIDEGADGILRKLNRSWEKIEFEDVKEKVHNKYTILLKMLKER